MTQRDVPTLASRDALIARFVDEQTRPWAGTRFETAALNARLSALNGWTTIFLYDIAGEGVELVGKSEALAIHPIIRDRATNYLHLLRGAVGGRPVRAPLTIAVNVDDEALDQEGVPMFSFQKRVGQRNILLPDIDLISSNYYADAVEDSVPYDDKRIAATFSGSTTGAGFLTLSSVGDEPFPRLRAARFFRDTDEVEFRLPNLVQCDEAARQALLREGFGTAFIGWEQTYASRFALSIDGNGAACSRPAMILKSNCVLAKYASEHVLFYFSALVDGVHFIELTRDADALRIVRHERASPGAHAPIAQNGRLLAERVLSRDFATAYTRALLDAYGDLLAD